MNTWLNAYIYLLRSPHFLFSDFSSLKNMTSQHKQQRAIELTALHHTTHHTILCTLTMTLICTTTLTIPLTNITLHNKQQYTSHAQEVDMTNLIALRNKHKEEFEKSHGVKLGFMSAFVRVRSLLISTYIC